MQPTPPQRMRAKQIAKENSIGESTVWRYVKLGLLTPIKLTQGMTVFNRAEVEAFFSGKSQMKVSQWTAHEKPHQTQKDL